MPLLRCALSLGLCACGGTDPAVSDAATGFSAELDAAEREVDATFFTADSAASTLDGTLPDASVKEGGLGGADGSRDDAALPRFSFFVTSYRAMKQLAGNAQGFGGDLRFGETGEGAGLRGADKICRTIAERSMKGAGHKTWRAFLSTTSGGANGGPVHAIERVGAGPWFDRLGRLVAQNKADLMQDRPAHADPAIINDLPNEEGVPNHDPDGTGPLDNHDTLTGSDAHGMLFDPQPGSTCNDWTSADGPTGTPRVGHSWVRDVLGTGDNLWSGRSWISSLVVPGCAAGARQDELGAFDPTGVSVGSTSGYGGIYCFALEP